MKYSIHQYARALYETLRKSPEEKRKEVFRRFYTLLLKDRKSAIVDRVLAEVERMYRKEKDVHKMIIESASGVSAGTKKEIMRAAGERIIVQENINPALMGGVTFFIDDEILIDASARRQLSKLFK